MFPYSLSNHLKPSGKIIIDQKNGPSPDKSASKDKYYFDKIIRKESGQQKQTKLYKSYSISQQNKGMSMIIPSFQAYQSKNREKISLKGALEAYNQDKQINYNKINFFGGVPDGNFESTKAMFKTQRISHTSHRNRFISSRSKNRQAILSNNTSFAREDIRDFASFNSEVLPFQKKSQQKAQKKQLSVEKPVVIATNRKIIVKELNFVRVKPLPKAKQPVIKLNQEKCELILYQKYSHNFNKFMEMYCQRKEIPENSKLFVFNSSDVWLKQALLKRGWIHNPDPDTFAYHLKWSTKIQSTKKKRFKQQIVNHFNQSDLLTSKNELAFHTRKSETLRNTIPRTYDLGSEGEYFSKNYEQTAILCGLKKIYQSIKESSREIKELGTFGDLLEMMEDIHKKKQYICEGEGTQEEDIIHIPYSLQICGFAMEIISKLQYEEIPPFYIINAKTRENLIDFSELNPPYHKFRKRRSESPQKKQKQQKPPLVFSNQTINLYSSQNSFEVPSSKLKTLITLIHSYLCKKLNTYQVQGSQNLWIVKTRNSSKGVGIHLSNNLYDICSKTQNRLVQKYLENCLLYTHQNTLQYKFDLRIWVLVTSFSPLIAYYFPKFYGRICSQPYDIHQFDKLTRHLTNYQLNRKNFSQKNQSSSVLTTQQIFKVINQKKRVIESTEELDEKVVKESFMKQLQKLLYETLMQYVGIIQIETNQENNFQMYGFDVLVSEKLSLHLLEVNLSPACDAKRNSWLQENIVGMADGLLDICLLDKKQGNGVTGEWKLLKQQT